jgi:peroxiredoxin
MEAAEEICFKSIGKKAPDFSLPGVDGKTYSLNDFNDKKIVVIVFTCNHCPFARGWEDRLIKFQKNYASKGVQLIAINSNDAIKFPEDSFEEMKKRDKEKHFPYPYLRDESQEVAKAFDAQVTPDCFVLNKERIICYRGRFDDNYESEEKVLEHDLINAVEDLLAGREVRKKVAPCYGCSIKWK